MRFTTTLPSTPDRQVGAGVVTTAFAALAIGVGTILFTSATAASGEPPAGPGVGVDRLVSVDASSERTTPPAP